jgi:hypothetical protein
LLHQQLSFTNKKKPHINPCSMFNSLADLGPITPHPRASKSPPSDADSVISSLSAMFADSDRACQRLKSYQPQCDDDDTTKVLTTALKYLPGPGRENLIEDIVFWTTNDEEIRQLKNHFVQAILNPSTYDKISKDSVPC